MNILSLPLRHLRARWPRAFLLAAVFTLGLASMSGLYHVSTLVADSMEKKLLSYGANILISPRQETLRISYGGYSLGDVTVEEKPLNLGAALSAIEGIALRGNIALVAPKMIAPARIDDRGAALVGVDWEQELQLKGYWEAAGSFPAPDDFSQALAGAAAAEKFALAPGSTLKVGGHELRVSGVLRPTGNDDDNVIFVSLPVAQALADKPGQASFLEVAALCSGCPIEDIVQQLQAALPQSEVRALAQVAESRMYSVHFARSLAFSVSLVILITACAMLIMSMLSSVAERRREIGLLRAVGFSRAGVFIIFVSEALCIGMTAGAAGYALGQTLTAYVLRSLRLDEAVLPGFEAAPCLLLILLAAAAAGLAAAFPAWRASRIEPAEALVAL